MKSILSSILAACVASVSLAQTDPSAKIDLALVDITEGPVDVGSEITVRLHASAPAGDQRYVVSDVIFGWDTSKLEFLRIDHTDSHPLIWRDFSGLPYCNPGQTSGCGDVYGLNEVLPPADGNGLYYGYNILGSYLLVSDAPVTIVDFKFKVVAPFASTEVQIIPEITVNHLKKTVVYGSDIPGMNVLGSTFNAIVQGIPNVLGDFDQDGVVGPADMAMLLARWGEVSFGANPYDLDGNGIIGAGDLAILMGNWR